MVGRPTLGPKEMKGKRGAIKGPQARTGKRLREVGGSPSQSSKQGDPEGETRAKNSSMRATIEEKKAWGRSTKIKQSKNSRKERGGKRSRPFRIKKADPAKPS